MQRPLSPDLFHNFKGHFYLPTEHRHSTLLRSPTYFKPQVQNASYRTSTINWINYLGRTYILYYSIEIIFQACITRVQSVPFLVRSSIIWSDLDNSQRGRDRTRCTITGAKMVVNTFTYQRINQCSLLQQLSGSIFSHIYLVTFCYLFFKVLVEVHCRQIAQTTLFFSLNFLKENSSWLRGRCRRRVDWRLSASRKKLRALKKLRKK